MAQDQTGLDNNHYSFYSIFPEQRKEWNYLFTFFSDYSHHVFLSAQKIENAEIEEEIKTSVTELMSIKDKQIFAVQGEILSI